MILDQSRQNVLNYFEVAANCTGNVVVKVLDTHGKIAKTVKQNIEQGISNFRLNLEDLQKGMYVINIFNDNNFVQAIRYIKN